LPDLRARVAIHEGQGTGLGNHPLGSIGGADSVTLKVNELPSHNHGLMGRAAAPITQNSGILATQLVYHPNDGGTLAPLDGEGVDLTPAGPTQAHENRQPYLVINFQIALYGTYPTRN
jgi:microcystin-dependent protein